MPKVTDEHRAEMRRRIEQAALRCVSRDGIANTSMSDIIRESGLSAGAIYGYYDSKDDLISSVASELITSRVLALDELTQRTPVPHPLDALAELVGQVPDEITGGALLQVWSLAPLDAKLASITAEWLQSFTRRISAYTAVWLVQEGMSEAQAAITADAWAPGLIGLAQGYFVRGALGGPGELERYRASLGALAGAMHPKAPQTRDS